MKGNLRVSIIFIVLTIAVIAGSVGWINSRSTSQEDNLPPGILTLPSAQDSSIALPATANPEDTGALATPVTLNRQAQVSPWKLTAAQQANWNRQHEADQARHDLGIKGCYNTGTSCKCLGLDNQSKSVDHHLCEIMASEPPIMSQ